MGRITHIKKADGSRERYTYDHVGNLLSATDGEEHTVTYRYNCRGLQASRTDAAGNTDHFRYDREGNLAESTDRNGNVLHYTYNMYGSMTSRRSQSGDINENFGYYPDGKLKTAIGGGMRYDYRYDVMGRLSEKSASGRTLLKYGYDLNGNKISMTDVTGKRTDYRYNSLDLLEEITDNGKVQARYTYNPDGTIKRLEVGNCRVTEYEYDGDKNIISQKTVVQGIEALLDNHYRYDGNANCIEKHTLSGVNRFTYDSMNQLMKAEYPTGVEEYRYDKAGNRTTRLWNGKVSHSISQKALHMEENYHYDSGNRLIGVDIVNPADSTCEQIHQKYTYDAQGNMLTDGNRQYTYDAMNRLTEVKNADGSLQKNRYDGEGLRAELEENGRLVSFIFDRNKVVQETDADQNTIRYIRGYELISSDSEKARTYYHYASDELGSITHIVDEDGKALNRYEYDAFGNFTVKEETVANRFGFTGEIYDTLTGQYYLRARFYNPVIGRFLQEDTYYGDGLNLYTYCHNNPVGYVDPSGNTCLKKYKEYKKEGYQKEEAYIKTRYDEIKRTQGVEAADTYMKSQVDKLTAKGYEFSDAWKGDSDAQNVT
ncbi:MAG: RHS repeat-associated core domain-containing protein [Lachnospiraceae bacterium]|nr:RHS repeat-associated core domain-containing protein [Lachnospiraceae bacterium]